MEIKYFILLEVPYSEDTSEEIKRHELRKRLLAFGQKLLMNDEITRHIKQQGWNECEKAIASELSKEQFYNKYNNL